MHGRHCSVEMNETTIPAPQPRLKFIDLARAIAILLMLEGHFVGLTLADLNSYRGNPVFEIWNFIRGCTAPLFFTVAGMIFVYLLLGAKEELFWKRIRVRKGLFRAGELIFWGYVLQLWLPSWRDYLRGNFADWFYAFHVLQSIGVGLILLVVVAWVCHFLKKLPPYAGYLVAMILCLSTYLWLKGLPEEAYFPTGWHQVIQNMFKGKYSVFPIAPWLSFVFLGGVLGSLLRKDILRSSGTMGKFWLFGVSLLLALLFILMPIVPGLSSKGVAGMGWFFGKSAIVVFFLAILRFIEIQRGIGLPWLSRVGQETFAIYIVHVMILYGGTLGKGLKNLYKESFEPWEAALWAAVFVASFAAYGVLLNILKEKWRAARANLG